MKIVIAVPVYNEAALLEKNILTLVAFCQKSVADDWVIVIADNNSSDTTPEIGARLAANQLNVEYLKVTQQGKGIAIKTAWESFVADVYCFMDADLATDLAALPPLISAITENQYDVAVGSRFHSQSKVQRTLARKIFSQGYRLVLKLLVGLKLNDAPCGFKAISQRIKTEVLPQVQNTTWFFDSELVIIAEKQGFKIKEIPVVWADPREGSDASRVKPLQLAWAYVQAVVALKARLKASQ